MDPSSSSIAGAGPQKRVLPARSRRGGPGIGTCEADLMILEIQKRQMESEPLVPADTAFLITSNSSKFSDDFGQNPEAPFTVNTLANERYFDRPEVLKAYQAQQIIQTPEFEAINESITVGGRFRPRGAEDESAETSDAAYEKRHKKFEALEKRGRVREKEKLKHEHYKLKERIEQLRAMDSSAFMAIPAASFSDPPPDQAAEMVDTNAYANGMVVNVEGERRRKEMLDNALRLEKRYSYLLPSDRVRKTQDTSHLSESHHDDSDTDRLSQVAGPSRKEASESLKFKIPGRSSSSATPAPSPAVISMGKPAGAAGGRKPKFNVAPKAPAQYRAIHTPASYAAHRERTAENFIAPPDALSVSTDEAPRSPTPTPPPPSTADSTASVPDPINNTPVVGRGKPTYMSPVDVGNDFQHLTPKKNAKHIPSPLAFAANEDGESEKGMSEDEEMQVRSAIQSVHTSPIPEVQAEPIRSPTPEETETMEQETDVEMHAPDEEILPEHHEPAESYDMTVSAAQSEATQEHAKEEEEEAPAPAPDPTLEMTTQEPAFEESISVRPAKRPRQTKGKARAVSRVTFSEARGSSIDHGENISTATGIGKGRKPGAKPHVPRGAVYYTSSSGAKELTTSKLVIAAYKREGTKRGGEQRATTAFGVPTPQFKDLIDFNLPEWFFYPESDTSRLPKAANNDDDVAPTPEGLEGAEEETRDSEATESPNESEDEDEAEVERAGSEDLQETKESDEREKMSADNSDTTELMDIDEPESVKDVSTARSSTEAEEDEQEEDELNEDIDIMPQSENEPGVMPREFSFPREDADEEVEY